MCFSTCTVPSSISLTILSNSFSLAVLILHCAGSSVVTPNVKLEKGGMQFLEVEVISTPVSGGEMSVDFL